MKFSDLKYLLAYTLPLSCWISINNTGWLSWLTPLYSFILIPVLEQLLKSDDVNEDFTSKEHIAYFDLLLFINLPLSYFILFNGLQNLAFHANSTFDIVGKVLSIGILLGSCCINVAHELGHKSGLIHQIAAKFLLLPCLYTHFTIQHNRGHHLNVGTPRDPASAYKNETIYAFWVRCIPNVYLQAWKLEATRLKNEDRKSWLFKNEMVLNTAMVFVYLLMIYYIFGIMVLLYSIVCAAISILLLETINYIEHYGLRRKQNNEGIYERVELVHSWNSNHQLGRIILYELTRHADHHYKSNKKYQTLLHYDQSPQLPYGYPASLLLALFPFIWFKKINPLLEQQDK